MALKKLAIFVEGGTEQHFVERLIRSIAEAKDIRIEMTKLKGGNTFQRTSTRISIDAYKDTQKYFIQIIDCGCDERVQSDVAESYKKLVELKFSAIIGIRDVHPKTHAEIPKLQKYLYFKIPEKPFRPTMLLAIMEIEAWFLAEHTHFLKISEKLTLDVVRQTLNFDPSSEDVEQRLRPAEDLHTVYQAAGEQYVKEPAIIQRTIDALDCERIYLELTEKIDGLKTLVKAVDTFFTPDPVAECT